MKRSLGIGQCRKKIDEKEDTVWSWSRLTSVVATGQQRIHSRNGFALLLFEGASEIWAVKPTVHSYQPHVSKAETEPSEIFSMLFWQGWPIRNLIYVDLQDMLKDYLCLGHSAQVTVCRLVFIKHKMCIDLRKKSGQREQWVPKCQGITRTGAIHWDIVCMPSSKKRLWIKFPIPNLGIVCCILAVLIAIII